MKLFFDKKDDGEVIVQVDGKDFSTTDYIKMIKEIKSKEKIEADYGSQISQDERDGVEAMLRDINRINEESAGNGAADTDEDINPDDIPF